VIGACSRTLVRACPTCPERVVGPLAGGFVLAPGPLATTLPNYEIRDLVIETDLVTARGGGLLVIAGGRGSLLGRLAIGDRTLLIGGSGPATGRFPHTFSFPRLEGEEVSFEIHATPAALPDGDGDGVPDGDDRCRATACGTPVDAAGCAIDQLCPCAMPRDGGAWRSHAEYVRCVIGASRALRAEGTLDGAARLAIIKAAADSTCGSSAVAGLEMWLARR
jgi:hypothetical protein